MSRPGDSRPSIPAGEEVTLAYAWGKPFSLVRAMPLADLSS
jgi:hypothetical protein